MQYIKTKNRPSAFKHKPFFILAACILFYYQHLKIKKQHSELRVCLDRHRLRLDRIENDYQNINGVDRVHQHPETLLSPIARPGSAFHSVMLDISFDLYVVDGCVILHVSPVFWSSDQSLGRYIIASPTLLYNSENMESWKLPLNHQNIRKILQTNFL